MGGHGGLNILPQKRWNVYNYENREKVRRDEEAAAKEEQLKREQVRKRDTEFRLEQLRTARGLAPLTRAEDEPAELDDEPAELEEKPGHINLFEGIKIFDPIKVLENEQDVERDGGHEKKKRKMKKEEVQKKVVTAEDEKYRLGYGVAGKGVKLPWYLDRPSDNVDAEGNEGSSSGVQENARKSGKKTLEELREERLRREKKEKERERALMVEKHRSHGTASRNRGSSRR